MPSGHPVALGPPCRRRGCLVPMTFSGSWWWPNRLARVPRATTAPPAGRSRRRALRRSGALDHHGAVSWEPAPVPDSQPGPGGRRLSAHATVPPVPRRPSSSSSRSPWSTSWPGTERPAGSGRSGGRWHRMGAGARSEGHSRPPATLSSDSRCGAAPAACAWHEFPLQPSAITLAVAIALVPFPPRRWPQRKSATPSWWAVPGLPGGALSP